VGSAALYPYTVSVSERFSRDSTLESPKIEINGNGGGFEQFCDRIGLHSPDIMLASRRIAPTEQQECFSNDVREIIELKIGHEAIVVARSRLGNSMNLSRKQVFLALARRVPDPHSPNTLFDNSALVWSELGPKLPPVSIAVFAPARTASARRAFEELVLDPGCDSYSWIKQRKYVNPADHDDICHSVRDTAYTPINDDDRFIVQKLDAQPNAVAFVSFGLMRNYEKELDTNPLEGVAPIYATISSGAYPASRSLYVYVKKAHVALIPGIRQFMAEYLSDRAIGQDGYLTAHGLVPLDSEERELVRSAMYRLRTYPLNKE
jgi:phosphate transport system substrate-binding protein